MFIHILESACYINNISYISSVSSVQSLSRVQLSATPWIAARQGSLSITNSRRGSPKLTSIESVMPSNHLILCRPILLLPSILPSIRVFSNESSLRIGWPKYWSFSFNISPSSEHPGLISFRMDWLDLLQSKGLNNWAIRERKKIYMQMVRHQTFLPFKIIVKSLALFRELDRESTSIPACSELFSL